MDVEAIVLAGGRGSRLGGIDKASLDLEGESMLDRTLRAVAGFRVIVVGAESVPEGIVSVIEEPRRSGPAAAIGAGLGEITSPYVLVVACDLPFLDEAIPVLLDWMSMRDGAIAIDDTGRRQNLMIAVNTASLTASVARHSSLEGLSVRTLLDPLDLVEVAVPARSTLDLDTWHDVKRARQSVHQPEAEHD